MHGSPHLAEEFVESEDGGGEEEETSGELVVKPERKVVNFCLTCPVKVYIVI